MEIKKANDELKEFWNNAYKKYTPHQINGKQFKSESFEKLINDYIKEDDNVLDYGCGAGWALFEITQTVKIKHGLGIDTSKIAIDYANACKDLSNIENIEYVFSDEKYLDDTSNKFDVMVSFNCFDVIPDFVIHSILSRIKKSLVNDGHVIIGINPEYPFEFLEKLGYSISDGFLMKDNIIRGNVKTRDEWIKLFTQYFELIEIRQLSLIEQELKYPRVVFVLKNC